MHVSTLPSGHTSQLFVVTVSCCCCMHHTEQHQQNQPTEAHVACCSYRHLRHACLRACSMPVVWQPLMLSTACTYLREFAPSSHLPTLWLALCPQWLHGFFHPGLSAACCGRVFQFERCHGDQALAVLIAWWLCNACSAARVIDSVCPCVICRWVLGCWVLGGVI